MKTFYVMWTYIGNYGGPWKREAKDARAAGQQVIDGFSPEFAEKGSVYVFDSPPVVMGKAAK